MKSDYYSQLAAWDHSLLIEESLIEAVIDGEAAATECRKQLSWLEDCSIKALKENDWYSFEHWQALYDQYQQTLEFITARAPETVREELQGRRTRALLTGDLDLENSIDRVVMKTAGSVGEHFRRIGLTAIKHS